MFIMHLALQGCLRGKDVEFGVTADTGGHIRYLLQLARASARDPSIDRIDIVTRAFDADFSSGDYRCACEYLSPKTRIVRLATPEPGYLNKERLWTELPAFTDALNAYIDGLERRPDFVHAHYADAARVASGVKQRHGIPFVFTAHSLGRPKRRFGGTSANAVDEQALDRRIGFEEEALEQASLILASSRDEAETQLVDYAHYDAGRIRVIAPGAELAVFRDAASNARVDATIGRFLSEPDKPALLAIARPVARKNLATLISAYGESPALQARANLVIMAGNRGDIDRLEPEIATNMREILALIDRYDLYGRIAYPKRHRPADVPAIYAWARARRGVFVNPAFNEPFGLTLLEAAAAGLPVVATDSGGPSDILEQCQNGLLVDACSPGAVAEAALRLLEDDTAWQRCADNGARAIHRYDWTKHAAQYHDLLGRLARGERRATASASLLVCDIDGTLTGSARGIDAFNAWHGNERRMLFGVATGRSLHSALAILEQVGLAAPRVLISAVGSEIHYLADDGVTYTQDRAWQEHIDEGWQRQAIADALVGVDGLRSQAPLEQREHKLSYFVEQAETVARVRALLHARGLACSVIFSHGRYLDVLPQRASKGQAVAHVRACYGVASECVYVAGDSGNDLDMLRGVGRAIIVANFRDDLIDEPGLEHAYCAGAAHADGVVEGVQHFRRLAREAS